MNNTEQLIEKYESLTEEEQSKVMKVVQLMSIFKDDFMDDLEEAMKVGKEEADKVIDDWAKRIAYTIKGTND